MDYFDESKKGIFLLILAVVSNFIAETMGCKTQKLLNNNMIAKHFVILFIDIIIYYHYYDN